MPSVAGGYKVLVVDDERAIADTLALIFSTHGYEARVAYSAEQAIGLVAECQPDLAIVDVVLPKMDGFDLALVLKAKHPGCRLLLLSGQPSAADLAEAAAKRGHIFTLLAKPMRPEDMLDIASNLLWLPQTESA